MLSAMTSTGNLEDCLSVCSHLARRRGFVQCSSFSSLLGNRHLEKDEEIKKALTLAEHIQNGTPQLFQG
ncbi:uncharacterized protein EI90DRAFT_3047277 [Cantharellus anzutake]|uniref:uncharacterized protein n=1 Tax=Cantharellus anzutake TaxID=1750568 RepID=UPI0019059A6F|nr:uncharacterized protein EI90DRAFT_3047277 [Cantharellus anzutake]KAF8335836.1 hypothetical protein EI90DRAFT_3047277 [Cantharellus anzutake]